MFQIAKREEVLDDIEEKIKPKSFFESTIMEEDKFELPSAMWEQVINRAPSKKHMEQLQAGYPLLVVERYVFYNKFL